MISNIILLDSILDIANCVENNDNNSYIARRVFDYCNDIKDMSLEVFLDKANINGSQLKKFYKSLDCNSFAVFKERIGLWCEVRRQQVIKECSWLQQIELAKVMFKLTNYSDFDDFFNINNIDAICNQIYHSERVIMYGSVGLLNLTHDFQIDMKIFGRSVVRSSMYEQNAILPNDNDFVWILSMMGRSVNMVGSMLRAKIINGTCQKLQITQHKPLLESEYLISLNTDNDYYEGQYVFMFYLDVIKTRYYELYIKE